MTQGQTLPHRSHPAQYHDPSDDEDEALSPSDGYFRSNTSVPNTVLILDPSHPQAEPSNNSSKAQDAARESSPFETLYTPYTPATTHTPATSSGDSESVYNGSTTRYRDSEDRLSERSPLIEEPPPLYDEAIAQRAPSDSIIGRSNRGYPPRSVYEPMQVREPVSSPRIPASGSGSASQSMSVGVNDTGGKMYDEESDPALPQRSRRRGCCRRKQDPKRGRSRFKRFLSSLLGTMLAVWLIVHLAKVARHAHGHSATPKVPVDGPFPPPPPGGPKPNRELRQHETSRSISGTYPLYDLLDLKTLSGSIFITIVPHPGHLPAILRLSTTSGSINVKIDNSYLNAELPVRCHDALNRTFDTQISSFSGSIRGSILIGGGGGTTVTSRSGSLNLALYPVHVDPASPESTLSTSTASGSSHIKVHPPILGGKMTQLIAHHDSTGSGSMMVMYPSTWEGGIHAKSVGSGSVYVRGQGLQFDQHGSREVVGWRGGERNGKTIELKTLGSGSISFGC